MIIGCYTRSECMKLTTINDGCTPNVIKLSHILDGTKVNVSSQIFHLGLFYKFIVQHKNIHLQHRHKMNFWK